MSLVNWSYGKGSVTTGLTPFRRSGGSESRPVARGCGQGDWSDHVEQQEASHPGAGRPQARAGRQDARRWAGCRGGVPGARCVRADVLPVAEPVRRTQGLRVPKRRHRRRVGSSTIDPPTADAPNVAWAVDFQCDADEQGRPIKICSIVGEHTRECIGGLVERSITADRLTAHLEDLVAIRGAPARCSGRTTGPSSSAT